MIHERNNKITLDAQIAEIREQIRLGKQSFPIDIVDTIGNDSQLYYELENGYWERYMYDGDGSLIGYQDSKNIKEEAVKEPTVDPKKKMKVYLVELNDVKSEDGLPYRNCTDESFIEESKRQGNVYTIKGYQSQMNSGQVSMVSKLIRFI